MIGNIPDGWQKKKLGECVDILDNQRIPLNSQDRENRIKDKDVSTLYPYYGATQQTGYIDDYIFDEELVLLGEDGVMFYDKDKPKAYLISGKTWVNNHAHVLRAKSNIAVNKYLLNYLNTFHYKGYVSGATRLKLNQSRMAQIPIPIPPLPQQEKIVKVLDISSALIEKQKELIQKYDLFLKSKFIEMFGNPISNPMGWEVVKFEDIIVLQRGHDLPTYEREKSGSIKVFGSNGVLDYHNEAKVKGGGVITGRSGTLGKVHYTFEDYWPLNTTLFSKDLKGNNIIFVAYFLEMFKVDRFRQGAGVPTLNRNLVHKERTYKITIALQNKFAQIVEKIEKIKEQETKKLQHLETLHKSLMDKAFKGEIQ